jgi:PKD repeat protein
MANDSNHLTGQLIELTTTLEQLESNLRRVTVRDVKSSPLNAVIDVSTNVIQVGQKKAVDGSGSTGPIENYKWFIDSVLQFCTRPTCYFTFDKVGSYNITLLVDGEGQSSSSLEIEVIDVQAVIDMPSSVEVNKKLTVDGSTSTGGDIEKYTWFIDSVKQDCSSPICDFTIDKVGVHDVALEIIVQGIANKSLMTVDVTGIPLKAEIVISPTTVQLGQEIKLDGSSSTGTIENYKWFVNSKLQDCSTGPICYFTIDKVDEYEIKLEVTAQGKFSEDSEIIVVTSPLKAVINVFPKTVQLGQEIKVDGRASTGVIESYSWFIDGKPHNCSLSVCSFTFDEADEYHIELEITSQGKSDSDMVTITITPPLKAIVEVSSDTIKLGQNIRLDGSASTGDIASYSWSIDDESQNCSRSVCYFPFDKAGKYEITLKITGNNGQVESNSVIISVVEELEAVPNISSLTSSGETPFIIELDGSGSKGDILEYKWQAFVGENVYGEAVTGEQNTIIFEECGTYTVELTVTDEQDKSDTQTLEKMINVWNKNKEICFHPLKLTYKPGDTFVLNLGINYPDEQRCDNFDMWMAIQVPKGIFGTDIPFLFFSNNGWVYEPQAYKLDLSGSTLIPYTLFEYTFNESNISSTGTHDFYAVLMEKDRSPMENLNDFSCSNLVAKSFIIEKEVKVDSKIPD